MFLFGARRITAFWDSVSLLEIYAHVKTRVIPIRMMIAAPTAVVVHAGNVFVYLRATFAVLRSVTINPCAISLKPPLAVRLVVTEGSVGA